jgi:ADP-ribose pyrophosphatase YjhB (NUDIX family)
MKEEFGIDVIIEKPFYVFTYTNQDNTKHTVEIVYFVKLQQLDQKIILNEDDHSEYRWITKKEITKYFQKNDEELNAGIK